MSRSSRRSFLALLTIFVAGCSGGDYPETVAVTGAVTLDGQPVPEAIITFMPTDGGRAATGYTNSSGQFTLTTYQPDDGAEPGAHQIAINPTEPPPMPGDPVSMDGTKPASPKSYVPPFPPKYGDPRQSGFTAEVTPDGENDFKFDMKSKS